MLKKIICLSLALLILASAFAQATPRKRSLAFTNPGSRRLLKTEAGNHYYYRSLPERSMQLRVAGLSSIELRSFVNGNERRPQVTVVVGRTRTNYDLTPGGTVGNYRLYAPLTIEIPQGTEDIEILCYSRNIYFRAFYTPAPRPRPTRRANLLITEHAGQVQVKHNGSSSNYFSFNQRQTLSFTISNNKTANLFVRARLVDRDPAVFELYKDGNLVERYEFDLRRTNRYTVQGVSSLSIGKKIVLDQGNGDYMLKAVSDNLFFARPVILLNP